MTPLPEAHQKVGEGHALSASASSGSVAGRAALSLVLLVGYFLLAAAVVGGLGFLAVEAVVKGGSGVLGAKLAVFTAVVALAIVRAVFAVERRGDDLVSEAVRVNRAEQPGLWGMVDEVSLDLGVPPPDDLWLVDDVNAFVRQDTRLLGLVGGERHLGLGAALLQVLTVDQLRGVVAHELGHYAGGDTRLTSLVYRASATVERTVLHLGPESLLGRLFALYARLYQRVSLAVRRRQELRADEGAVRTVGRQTHEGALREATAAAAAWEFFGDSYVAPLWRAGTAPRDLYAGYRAMLADPMRQEQVAKMRCADDEPGDPYDSHPRLSARVAHAQSIADRTPPGDVRPARALLRDAAVVEQQMTARINCRALGTAPGELYEFGDELDPTPYVSDLADEAAVLSRATAAVDGGVAPAGLGRTLDVLEQGRDAELVTALTNDRRDLGEQARRTDLETVVAGPLAMVAEAAAVQAGRASWRASWSGPVALIDDGGDPLDLSERLAGVLKTGGVAALRGALLAAGVPLGDVDVPELPESDDIGDQVLDVWPDLLGRTVLPVFYDALVTADLLVLVRQRRSLRSNLGRNYGVGRSRLRRAAKARVDALLVEPLQVLQERPGVWVLRWEDQPSARFRRAVFTAWELRLPGQDRAIRKLRAEDETVVPEPEDVAILLRRLLGDRLQSKLG